MISIKQNKEGPWYYFRGAVVLETTEYRIRADEIDYNEDTSYAEARGNVRFASFIRGEQLEADRAEYFLDRDRGRFYKVTGSAPAKIDVRPGLLTTTNPFVFQGNWAERLKDRYILYDGFVTNCRLPKPWWVLRASRFDIVPGERAIAYQTRFVFRRVPLFYSPAFYKSLREEPRKSGWLIPNIGNSSRRGKMIGVGYFWALHRSYDATYRSQLFTQRGFAHQVDFRGKPTQSADFDVYLYGVNDRGLKLDNGDRLKQGGFLMTIRGKSDLPGGFRGRAEVNYLSSFTFRQAFTESFNEAVFSEVNSIGFASKEWSGNSLNFVFQRYENYQSDAPGDRIVIRKLPSVEFSSRDKRLFGEKLPLWYSLDSSAALARRNQPLFQTRQFVERFDVAPRLMTRIRWKDFTLLPSVSVRETKWGSSQADGRVRGDGILRSTRDLGVELLAPSLARVFSAPQWLGDKLKHVIEPRAGFRYTGGVEDFSRVVRFDETELVSNTREIDYSLTNRFYVKRGASVQEVLSWQLWQKRYLDPDLGGAVVSGQRNVFLTQTSMTGYAFFDGPRKFSPIVSSMNLAPLPSINVEWRTDYDTIRHRIVNSTVVASLRRPLYFISAGHNQVRSSPVLAASANQFIGLGGIGRQDQRGWSVGYQAIYDFKQSRMQFATTQVTYATDCCGLSVQYRRFGFGNRNENQFRVAFAVSNIGSFGTLRRQERVF